MESESLIFTGLEIILFIGRKHYEIRQVKVENT